MNMFDGLITDSIKQLHADAMTELVTATAIECSLIFGQTLFTDCPNCIFDPVANKSSNRYQTGGLYPFQGICPLCHGVGKFPDEQTATVNLCLIYNYKDWMPIVAPVNSPEGYIQTLSLLNTLDNLKQAKEMIADTSLVSSVRQRFERYGEPQPCGFGQATIIATMWKRIEN